jgi:TRAP-type uncharacterized transport system fused permease subunit
MAGGIEAAASSGGALVPPVMGAAAYMMLEIVSPPVTYLQIVQAALLPAILFYLSLFLIVHFHAKRLASRREPPLAPAGSRTSAKLAAYAGLVFFAGRSWSAFLLAGYRCSARSRCRWS